MKDILTLPDITSPSNNLNNRRRSLLRQRSHSFDCKDDIEFHHQQQEEGGADNKDFSSSPSYSQEKSLAPSPRKRVIQRGERKDDNNIKVTPPSPSNSILSEEDTLRVRISPSSSSVKSPTLAPLKRVIQRGESKDDFDVTLPSPSNSILSEDEDTFHVRYCPSSSANKSPAPSPRKRLIQRGESKDDIEVMSSSHSTSFTQEALPILSPRQSVCKDDSVVGDGGRSSVVQMLFIRVHIGFKTFSPRNHTVAVAIYFQPTLLVYEVVILDVLEEKELSRLYVYQSEIAMQMRKRKAMLMSAGRQFSSKNLLGEVSTSSGSAVSESSSLRVAGSRQNRATMAKARVKRRTDAQMLKSGIQEWQQEHNCENSISWIQKLKEDDDIDLNTIDVHSLNFNSKLHQQELLAKIILKCLQSIRVGGLEHKFRLVNEVRQSNFLTYTSVPVELDALLPTPVDPAALISQAKRLSGVVSATQMLRNTVSSANLFSEHTRTDLMALDSSKLPQRIYKQENALNPNKLKWRYLWQKSINSVIMRNRASRKLRQSWGELTTGVMEQKRTKDETVKAMISEQRPAGFRSLRARRHGVMTEGRGKGAPMSVEEITQYRDEIAARRREMKEKTMKDLL